MTRWKKAIAMAAALVLTLGLAVPALALGEIDLTKSGVITLQVMEGEGYPADLADAVTDVTVYQVATVNEYGAFALTEPFMSLQDGATSIAWNGGILNSDEQVKALLEAAKALVQPAEPEEGAEPVEPTEPPAEGEAGIKPVYEDEVLVLGGEIKLTDDPDTDVKEDLGLFLVIPDEVETTLWDYRFSSALVAVPSIARAAEDESLTEDAWQYNVPMYLKAERERRLMEMEIAKTLQHYNRTLGPTTFVFDVVARLEGEVVFQTTAQITFSDDSSATQTVTVKNIPAGAAVTVTEVYTGESYTLVGADGSGAGGTANGGQVTFEISDLTLPEGRDVHRVGFTNDYTGSLIPDSHVENVFTADGETHWSWASDKSEGGNG